MIDRDAVVAAAIAGASLKTIARRHECAPEEVSAALDEFAAEMLSPRNRARILSIEVERLDALERVFLQHAIANHDSAAGTLVGKISQRRSALLGLDQPVRLDLQIVAPEFQVKLTRFDGRVGA